MKVAILVNQYPCVSHTFIRREIHALEGQGVEVVRVSIRAMPEEAVPDPVDRRELGLTDALLGRGVRPLLAAGARAALRRPWRFAAALALATRIGRVSERGLLRNYAYLAEACLLREKCASEGVEHVHAHFGTNSAAVAMLCRELGGPRYSFTVHGPEEFDAATALSLTEKIRRATFVVGVSSFGRSQLLRHAPVERWHDVHVVRCGLDRDFLTRARSSVPDVPELVCVGRLCEQKGQLILLEALAALRARGHSLRLVLVGDGPMRGAIERRVAELGLDDAVTITGWASSERVRECIERARALVLPSFAEGLPVVLMEAMARGRPVISTYVAGIPELVTEDVGRLVPASSIEGLAAAMEEMLHASPQRLTDLGRRGAQRVARLHDARQSGAQLAGLFAQAVRGMAPGAHPEPGHGLPVAAE
jgi:colanic acid/amylovoran biosynthesis glycosyltransferase